MQNLKKQIQNEFGFCLNTHQIIIITIDVVVLHNNDNIVLYNMCFCLQACRVKKIVRELLNDGALYDLRYA